MSTPSIPPRPQRNSQPTEQATATRNDQPLVPPRPVRKTNPSPTRSPLNFPPTALGNRPPPRRESQDLPRRPPSVSLPQLGHEGDEYSSFDQLPSEAHGVSVDNEQTRNVAADLPMHQPKASVPQSTATKNISRVRDTDSTTAAGLGIGRPRPADDVHKQPPGDASTSGLTRVTSNTRRAPSTEPPSILRTKASFSRSTPSLQLERQTSRPASVYGDDAEHGIPEIGQQIPLNKFAGDAQAPTPGGGQSAYAPGIGFFNDGSSKQHKKKHSRQEFLTHDSYGLEHDENHADQFEREWMKKHPQEAAKEHLYRHLPKPASAMSSEQLNKLIHGSESGAAPLPSTPGEEDAIQEYISRMSPATDRKKRTSSGDVPPASPFRKSFANRGLHPDNAIDDDQQAPKRALRYDSEDEHVQRDGTPILAADEVLKRPGSAFMPPAVVPEPRADDDYYYESGGEHGSRRSSMHVPSRPSSRPGSVHGAQGAHGYGGGSLHRFVSHEEVHHSGSGTPLEEIEEYEPLFPEDGEEPSGKPKALKKRPDLAAMHHFPSQDVWEDTPASLQYSAEVSTPEIERQQEALNAERAAVGGVSTFETPEQEQARKYAGGDMTSKDKTFITPHYKPGAVESLKAANRPSAHRFPSSDVWEDTPSSMLGETTVSTPEMDDVRSPPEDRATTSALPGQQDDLGARATTAGGLSISKPSVPATRPQRGSKLSAEEKPGDEQISPTKTKAPSIPAKPSIPARPARAGRGDGAPLEQSRSGGSDEGATSPTLQKTKPAVPARPGSKISALQGNFLSDLNNRLKLGPQAPPKKEEPQVSEEAEREPLADARKSRAKGPPRRKPAASPVSDRKQSATFAMSPLITCWTIDETDELQVQNESEKENKDPETARDAPKAEKILEQNEQVNTESAAPAEASEVASNISKSRHPSETAQGHAASADALRAALAEAGAGPAVEAIEEEAEALPSAETVKAALPETVQTTEKVKAEEIPGGFPGEEGEVVVKEATTAS
ncbi:Putative altered inheritance of mitochondria protein [Septoria linicola]|uniref:Altered inheritance of mitochondria protein n=1 Tax=Septoria linicola TaxID=215465 RepID=A0A9Q9B0C8_9PEZI|nr:putative altered inheritance of mitochondria protein [Septoria linicola]USW55011.1 Putative altered inheritance of mitochondria protein [Septoria linicola]